MSAEEEHWILFLDVDGVLNDHQPHANRYCGLVPECLNLLCYILSQVPQLKIVLSSAWRYLILGGNMSLRGFEFLLYTYGADPQDIAERLIGTTVSDEEIMGEMHMDEWKEHGIPTRRKQIRRYVEQHNITKFCVLDDLQLHMDELVQTDGRVGLTQAKADQVIAMFRKEEEQQ